jgi:hypothetical protein
MSSIEDLINNVMDQDFAKAGPMFSELMQQKLTDALDQEKVRVAGAIFNDDEDGLEEISDEEIGEIVDDEDEEEEEE